jgi:hypothetical protein
MGGDSGQKPHENNDPTVVDFTLRSHSVCRSPFLVDIPQHNTVLRYTSLGQY